MAQCESNQGYLVAINDFAENEFLLETFGRNYSEYFAYIGARQDESEKTWWINGDPWQFESWSPGEPNYPTEMCVVMFRGGWVDSHCDQSFPFICERPFIV